jgi:tellurite resistance protein TehA-like permease
MWLVETFEGWLKMLQWITTFLAFVILVARLEHLSYYPEYDFMVFVGVTAFVFVTIHIILKLTHLFEKLPTFLRHPIVGIGCCILAVVAFLSSSSVVLYYSYKIGSLEASAACGFIAMFLFLIEAIYIYCRSKRQQRDATQSSKTVEKVQSVETTKQSTAEDDKNLFEFPP